MRKLRRLALKMVLPIILLAGKIYSPYSHKRFKGSDYYKIRDSIVPGDIILTTTRGEASNIFNSSSPNHGALYVGGGVVKYVNEALGKGVSSTDLVSFLLAKDDVVILKPLDVTKKQRLEACRKSHTLVGLPYDMLFEADGGDEYYCFELIMASYQSAVPERKFKSSIIWGVKTYRAQDILADTANWEVIYDNRE